MKVLYVDKDKKMLDVIFEKYSKSHHEIFLLDDYKSAIFFLSKTKDIDLIITGLDSFTLDKIAYLEKLRKLNRNLKIIVLFRDNINISFEKLAFLNIEKFIKKPFNIKVIEFIFHNLEKTKF